MIANAAGPVVGIVDATVIGRMGNPLLLAGIGLGAVIYAVFYWGFGFLRMSTAGLAAQADGAGDQGAVQAHLVRAVPLGVAIGLLIFALQIPLMLAAFVIFPGEPGVESAARTYISGRLWGLPATLGGIALMGWFIGIGRPRRALYMQIVLNVINGVLSVFFVTQLNMGVAGVAAGSAIAEICGLAMGLYMASREIAGRGGLRKKALTKDALLDKTALSNLGITNSNIFIRTMCLTTGFSFFGWQAANQGADFLASNHILLQFINMVALVLDSFAHVAEAAVGSAYGAKSKTRFTRAIKLTSEFAIVAALICSIIIFIGGPFVIDLMTTDIGVRGTAKTYLPWCALSPILGVAAFQLDGIFIGVTHTAAMRNAGIAALAVYIAAHFALFSIFGAHGIWMAFLVYYIARAVTLGFAYPGIVKAVDS